jgi:hypothetical protein
VIAVGNGRLVELHLPFSQTDSSGAGDEDVLIGLPASQGNSLDRQLSDVLPNELIATPVAANPKDTNGEPNQQQDGCEKCAKVSADATPHFRQAYSSRRKVSQKLPIVKVLK